MKVAITGATGGLGRHLCDRFLESGDEVIAIQRGTLALDHPRCRELRADLGDLASLPAIARALGSPRLVIHAAVRCDPHADDECAPDALARHLELNALAPYLLARELAKQDAPTLHVVFATLSSELLEPAIVPYGISKLALAGLTRHLARLFTGTPHAVATIVLGSLATPAHFAGVDAIIGDRGLDRAAVARALLARRLPAAVAPDPVPLDAVHQTITTLLALGPAAHGAIWRLDHGTRPLP